jgi:hypothetical protein
MLVDRVFEAIKGIPLPIKDALAIYTATIVCIQVSIILGIFDPNLQEWQRFEQK